MKLRLLFSILLSVTATVAMAQKLAYDKTDDGERCVATSFKSIYTRGSGNAQMSFGAFVSKTNNVTFYIGIRFEDASSEISVAKGRRIKLDLSDGSSVILRTEDRGRECHERHITPIIEMHSMFGWHTMYHPFYNCFFMPPYPYIHTYDEIYDTETVIVYFEATPQQLLDIAEKKVTNVHLETDAGTINRDIWSNKFSKTLIKEYHIVARCLGME